MSAMAESREGMNAAKAPAAHPQGRSTKAASLKICTKHGRRGWATGNRKGEHMSKIMSGRAVIAGLTALLLSAAPPPRDLRLDNAEDLASVAGSPWVIASSMAGGPHAQGALAAIDRRDRTIRRLYPEGRITDTPGGLDVGDCPGMPAANTFKPHGIAYVAKGEVGGRLYVVNHGGRESIEFFDLALAPAPRLRWVGCTILPSGAFGNGVAAVADGTLYMTNMGRPLDGSEPLSDMGGEVVAWRPMLVM
jgi:hypothetical protein